MSEMSCEACDKNKCYLYPTCGCECHIDEDIGSEDDYEYDDSDYYQDDFDDTSDSNSE